MVAATSRARRANEESPPCRTPFARLFSRGLRRPPAFEHSADRHEIGFGTVHRIRHREQFTPCRADHQGGADRFRVADAQAHVRVGKPGVETDIERAGRDRAGRLVLARAVASRAGIDDIDTHARIDAGRYAHHHRFARHGEQVVRERHRLVEPRRSKTSPNRPSIAARSVYTASGQDTITASWRARAPASPYRQAVTGSALLVSSAPNRTPYHYR